ncbi:MAG TPA: L-aspartate oxidase [Vicinamibacterales bacterium]
MQRRADFVVIGSGIAGLRAAIELVRHGTVLLVTKSDDAESNTGYAQGGIAAALGPDDSPELHRDDTLEAGAGLCDPRAVEVLVGEGPHYVRELIAWGAAFDRDADGRPALAREGAHSVRRVLHARDATGREIGRTLLRQVAGHPELAVLDHALATGLVIENGRCAGVDVLLAGGERLRIAARAVLLAAGGAGHVYRETTNPGVATGDGVAMAWRAGARVSDLEFVQFHPTVLQVPGAPRFLISEAVRGEGARLINADGEAFMTRYDPRGDLAPRDVVAIAMVRESIRTGSPVYLSLQHLDPERMRARFPGIAEACQRAGVDIARDRVPVSPAAHYLCGGVDTDLDGRTSIPGLFAAGEVACTRVHGANRLASNSLLEGLVFGARAAAAMAADPDRPGTLPEAVDGSRTGEPAPADPIDPDDVPTAMWQDAGLVRDGQGLTRLVAGLGPTADRAEAAAVAEDSPAAWRRASIARVGWLIARAALRRTESRGGHRRADVPDRDDVHWKVHVADVKRTGR